ncbi:hypothetical protein FIBSPDRAFT_905561 [Athelia psychrophila]|uniref:Uncharacterized protein n=1 Tax=Athelia psychrophila TaxID=1759441 RepID=A0A167TBL3_9AGAM|nr:hypothetical protein FIBSPDRAFT_905561 [Fibularhizoctonia sp. CBS 109695]
MNAQMRETDPAKPAAPHFFNALRVIAPFGAVCMTWLPVGVMVSTLTTVVSTLATSAVMQLPRVRGVWDSGTGARCATAAEADGEQEDAGRVFEGGAREGDRGGDAEGGGEGGEGEGREVVAEGLGTWDLGCSTYPARISMCLIKSIMHLYPPLPYLAHGSCLPDAPSLGFILTGHSLPMSDI